MNFEALREETIKRLREHRSRDKSTVALDLTGASESIPVDLIRDPSISSQAKVAWVLMRSYGPVAFVSNEGLSKVLGGHGGATNATDELFLRGWISKEIVHDEDGSPIGTAYVLFNLRKTPEEMKALGVGWEAFVRRLSGKGGRNRSRLAKIAKSLIYIASGNQGPEFRGRKSGGNLIEGVRSSKATTTEESSSSGANALNEARLTLPADLEAHLDARAARQVRDLLSQAAHEQVEAFFISASKASPESWNGWAINSAKLAAAGGLNTSNGTREARRVAEIEKEAKDIIEAAQEGHRILVDGKAVKVEADGWVDWDGRTDRLRRLIAEGAQIQIA